MESIKPEQSGLIYHEKEISVFVKKRNTLIFFFLQQNQRDWVPRADTRGKLRFNPNCGAGKDKAPQQSLTEHSRLLSSPSSLHRQTTVKICTDLQLPRKAPPKVLPWALILLTT